jgi:hypothetical protein
LALVLDSRHDNHSFGGGDDVDQHRRHTLNAAGDFYVADGMCIACTAPEHEAPDLMSHSPEAHAGYHCHFKCQPTTPDEWQRAVMAVAVGCCGAVRYGGTDPAILRRLAELSAADMCDQRAEPLDGLDSQ